MNKILLATGNKGKAQEILDFFEHTPFDFDLLSDFPPVPEPEETGNTFEANALLKAKYFGGRFRVPTLAEDAGLILDAFPEKFGLKTRREIQAATDVEWMERFMEIMKEVEDRKATFFSSIAFYDPAKNIQKIVSGRTSGIILKELNAPMEEGIPISAVFLPEGYDRVYSAMSKSEKNAVSHRGKAARSMQDFLNEIL